MSDLDNPQTGPNAFGRRVRRAAKVEAASTTSDSDVVDADFVVLTSAAGERIFVEEPAKPATPFVASHQPMVSAGVAGMEMLQAGQSAATPRRGGPIFWVGGLVVALAAFWIAGGHAVLRPALLSLQSGGDNGLRIASVTSKVDRSGLKPVLLIDGRAINDGDEVEMPPLDIRVTSAGGGTTFYKLGTARNRIAAGDSFDFSSRLDLPKDGIKAVFVTFAE